MNPNKTTPTLPRMAALKAEAVATATNQPVVDALCAQCSMTTQAIQQIKQDMADFDIHVKSVAHRSGYSERRIAQILKDPNPNSFALDVVRQTVDQLIAKSKTRRIKIPTGYAPFDDGTDDRDLFCAGVPKNLAVLMTGGAA